jgi:hypothetical protein
MNAFNFGKKFKCKPSEKEGGVILSKEIIRIGITIETNAISKLIDLFEYCCNI